MLQATTRDEASMRSASLVVVVVLTSRCLPSATLKARATLVSPQALLTFRIGQPVTRINEDFINFDILQNGSNFLQL
jgi:hypothetical protein